MQNVQGLVCLGASCAMAIGMMGSYVWGFRNGLDEGYRKKELELAFDEGMHDYRNRISRDDSPYNRDDELFEEWLRGWLESERDEAEHRIARMKELDRGN